MYVLVGEANFVSFSGENVQSYTMRPPPGLPFALPTLPPRRYEFNYEVITQLYRCHYVARAVKWIAQESLLFGAWIGLQPRIYWETFSEEYWSKHDPELVHNCGFAGTMTGFQKLQTRGLVRFTHEKPNATTTAWPTSTFIDLSRLG
jgi:hypothetical protein